MSYLSLNEEDMEDEEVKVMREMNRLLSSNPKYKNLSPEELVEALDLKPEDKELVQQGLQQMLTSAEAELDTRVTKQGVYLGLQEAQVEEANMKQGREGRDKGARCPGKAPPEISGLTPTRDSRRQRPTLLECPHAQTRG